MLTRLLHPHPATDFTRTQLPLAFRVVFSWLVGAIGRRPFAIWPGDRSAAAQAPARLFLKSSSLIREHVNPALPCRMFGGMPGNIREGPD